jgi:hypothetical protein
MNESRRVTGRGPARSRFKERFWRGHLSRQARGKLTVRDYCAQADLSEPSFYAWRSELVRRDSEGNRVAAGTPAAGRRPPASSRRSAGRPRFLPVTIRGTALAPSVTSQVELVLPSGLLVRVPAQDAAALRVILELLEPRSC